MNSENNHDLESLQEASVESREVKKIGTPVWIALVCSILVAAVMLTYALTATSLRKWYLEKLSNTTGTVVSSSAETSEAADQLESLMNAVKQYSYYSESMSEEEMLNAAFKAYVQASGDKYAEYYTAEEYAELIKQSSGSYYGIGVTVSQIETSFQGQTYKVFRVISIIKDSPAELQGLQIGDMIIAVGTPPEYVSDLGYDQAIAKIRGEEGTQVHLYYLREEGGTTVLHEADVTRQKLVSPSVTYKMIEETKVGYIHISGFELYTPKQFKEAVEELKNQGAEQFVFDVRDNPGGYLISIRAILSYFLEEGDLMLQAIDKNQKVVQEYRIEPCVYTGNYAECSVGKSEIGIYKDLKMVVLCNENTASAAEVFTATMRDYELAEIVGKTTFGKGIMQETRPIQMGNTVGYVKLTTCSYVTKCGVSYHEIGISPKEENQVTLSEEAKKYAVSTLPLELDTQLARALDLLK